MKSFVWFLILFVACATDRNYIVGTTGRQLAQRESTRITLSFERFADLTAAISGDVMRNHSSRVDGHAAAEALRWWAKYDPTLNPDAASLVLGKKYCHRIFDECEYSPFVVVADGVFTAFWWTSEREDNTGREGALGPHRPSRSLRKSIDITALIPPEDWVHYRWVRTKDDVYLIAYDGERVDEERISFAFGWGTPQGHLGDSYLEVRAILWRGQQ